MYFASFLLVVLLASDHAKCFIEYEAATKNHDWDILIFTQRWPATACLEWKDKEPKNTCSFPTLRDIWTIHGIWPTKLGTEGPWFCNNSWHFDPAQIKPFEQQLNIYWLNIERNTPLLSFWKHEWMKHGTCSASLPDLDSESKYFKQGLDWIGKYDMQSVLSKGGILPNKTQGYSVREIYNTLKAALGKNPKIECLHEQKTGLAYIDEIRLCFNKKLELVDCDGIKDPNVHPDEDIITNCPLTQSIVYTNVVPVYRPVENVEFDIPWQLNLFRFLQFLIWFTL